MGGRRGWRGCPLGSPLPGQTPLSSQALCCPGQTAPVWAECQPPRRKQMARPQLLGVFLEKTTGVALGCFFALPSTLLPGAQE